MIPEEGDPLSAGAPLPYALLFAESFPKLISFYATRRLREKAAKGGSLL